MENKFIPDAIDIISKAIEADNAGEYEKALNFYRDALGHFTIGLKYVCISIRINETTVLASKASTVLLPHEKHGYHVMYATKLLLPGVSSIDRRYKSRFGGKMPEKVT